MTTGNREELFQALAALARRYPEWRFGQLIANLADWADVPAWDIEDEQLVSVARSHLKRAEAVKAD
ncbi:MAG: hypothetical protein ACRC33_16775 [Gemmataceae bacterium]